MAKAARKKKQVSSPHAEEQASAPVSVPLRDQKMLWGAAAGRCSFPKCGRRLVADRSQLEGEVLLGEMAHIIAKSPGGPRGGVAIAEEERNRYRNLILLCEEHHKIVDTQRATFPPEALQKFKQDHEARCHEPFGGSLIEAHPLRPWVNDRVFSTLLPVLQLPRKVFTAEAVVSDWRTLKQEFVDIKGFSPPPAVLREGHLFAFDDLGDDAGVFSRWVRPHTAKTLSAPAMWDNEDRRRYYVALLNVILRKLAGRSGLEPAREDLHWYFPPGPDGEEVKQAYQPMNNARSERNVAWRPTVKATGEKKKYWEHLAVGLGFIQVAKDSWVLSIRPERHFTRDGREPLTSAGTARRSTSRACRLYNGDVLEDAQFWRSFLSQGKPRIIWKAGGQHLIVDARLLDTTIGWPGVPDDHKSYANADVEDDLFTLAELKKSIDGDDFEDEGADDVMPSEDDQEDDNGAE